MVSDCRKLEAEAPRLRAAGHPAIEDSRESAKGGGGPVSGSIIA